MQHPTNILNNNNIINNYINNIHINTHFHHIHNPHITQIHIPQINLIIPFNVKQTPIRTLHNQTTMLHQISITNTNQRLTQYPIKLKLQFIKHVLHHFTHDHNRPQHHHKPTVKNFKYIIKNNLHNHHINIQNLHHNLKKNNQRTLTNVNTDNINAHPPTQQQNHPHFPFQFVLTITHETNTIKKITHTHTLTCTKLKILNIGLLGHLTTHQIITTNQHIIQHQITTKTHINNLTNNTPITPLNPILHPQIQQKHTQLTHYHIHVPFINKHHLQYTKTTKYTHKQRINSHNSTINPKYLISIKTNHINDNPTQHHQRKHHIGTPIHQHINFYHHQNPIISQNHSMINHRTIPFNSNPQILKSFIHNLDQSTTLTSQKHNMTTNHQQILFFPTKSTTYHHLHNHHFIVTQTKQTLDNPIHIIQTLQRTLDDDTPVHPQNNKHPLKLNIKLFLQTATIHPFNDTIHQNKRDHNITTHYTTFIQRLHTVFIHELRNSTQFHT